MNESNENVVPLDYAVIGFPGNEFTGDIAPELARLVDDGLIRIIDLIFITKGLSGFEIVEFSDLSEDVHDEFAPLAGDLTSMLTEEDVASLAELIPPESSALILLWQNIWTEKIRRAVLNANGILLAHERIPADVLNEVMDEIAAGD